MRGKNLILALAWSLALVLGSAHAAMLADTPQIFAPDVVSSVHGEGSATFTPDGKTVYFMRGDGDSSTILESHLVAGKWTTPRIAPFSGHWRDLDPAMAPDGSYLLFVSNRPIAPGGPALDALNHGKLSLGLGMNLWRVDRRGDGWTEPARLPDAVNASTMTFAPSIAANGDVYFIGRIGPDDDLTVLRSHYRDGYYIEPSAVSLGSADDKIRDPAIAPDQSFMVFSIAPRASEQPLRLAIAFREGDHWSKPLDLGDEINGAGYAMGGHLGADGHTLFFDSARVDKTQPFAARSWNNGDDNIWSVSLLPWLHQLALH